MQFFLITLDYKYIAIDINDEMTMQDFQNAITSKFAGKVTIVYGDKIVFDGSENCKAFLTANEFDKGLIVLMWEPGTDPLPCRVTMRYAKDKCAITNEQIKTTFTNIPGMFDNPKLELPTKVMDELFHLFKAPAPVSNAQMKQKKLKSTMQAVRDHNRAFRENALAEEPREHERKVSGRSL